MTMFALKKSVGFDGTRPEAGLIGEGRDCNL
jgi:hypothetical protein